jgi:hypothetical protein
MRCLCRERMVGRAIQRSRRFLGLHVMKKPTGAPFSPTTTTSLGSRFSQRSGQQRNPNLFGSPTPAQQRQQALGVLSTQSQTTTSAQDPPSPQRINKVMTVSPTPHHPKVSPSSEPHSLSQISKSPPSTCGNASYPRPGSRIRLTPVRPLLGIGWRA